MSSTAVAILDAGPLYAATDPDDEAHERCVAVLRTLGIRIVVPSLVIAAVLHFIGKWLSPAAEARVLLGMAHQEIEHPHPQDWARMAELVDRYRNFPLGGVDASVVALAERLNTRLIITLDRRHFAAIRPRHVPAFRLLPD